MVPIKFNPIYITSLNISEKQVYIVESIHCSDFTYTLNRLRPYSKVFSENNNDAFSLTKD